MVLTIVALGSATLVLMSRIEAKNTRIQTLAEEIVTVQADVTRWQVAWGGSQATIARFQKEIDAADAGARKIQERQMATVAQRQIENRATQNRTGVILQTLKDQTDVSPTINSPVVHDGFDPVVLAGIRWLQCLQSAAAIGSSSTECRGRAQISAGRPFAPDTSARTGRYAPSVTQQLWLLGLVYRFRDWGAACYADKDAIAESQINMDFGK
jgi:hypothetical protein